MHKNRDEMATFHELPQASWRAEDWGDMHVSFETYRQEVDFQPYLEGLPNNQCDCPHWGYVIQGRMHVIYGDRQEEVSAGEAYYVAPNHSLIVDAGTELIEFSPREAFAAHMWAADEAARARAKSS